MPSSDVAADMCSSDSLSLTGLVCTQDQSSISQPSTAHEPRHNRKNTKNDINFEFSYSAQSPLAVKLHKKTQSTDLFDLKLNQQSHVHGNVTMKDVLEPHNRSKKFGSNKEVGRSVIANNMNKEVGKYGSKEHNNGGFVHKLMQSIITPCRSCSAVEPSAAVKKMQDV
ncbi:hypothetical protein Tco_0530939 [Tanacetum coccineum]